MTEKTKVSPKHVFTPQLAALELKGFAEAVQLLAEQIAAGQSEDATNEQRTAAEQAANALLRNAPGAIRAIRKLEGYADEITELACGRRDDIMTSMFGPDTA